MSILLDQGTARQRPVPGLSSSGRGDRGPGGPGEVGRLGLAGGAAGEGGGEVPGSWQMIRFVLNPTISHRQFVLSVLLTDRGRRR